MWRLVFLPDEVENVFVGQCAKFLVQRLTQHITRLLGCLLGIICFSWLELMDRLLELYCEQLELTELRMR